MKAFIKHTFILLFICFILGGNAYAASDNSDDGNNNPVGGAGLMCVIKCAFKAVDCATKCVKANPQDFSCFIKCAAAQFECDVQCGLTPPPKPPCPGPPPAPKAMPSPDDKMPPAPGIPPSCYLNCALNDTECIIQCASRA